MSCPRHGMIISPSLPRCFIIITHHTHHIITHHTVLPLTTVMAHVNGGRGTKRMAYYMIMDGSGPAEARQHRHQAAIGLLRQGTK